MLKISKDLKLPLDFATQTVAILAKKRVGKTYTASVIAEECIESNIPFVALDPTGAWYGLRSSADGKKAGYPVVIIGGQHGDIPLTPTAGKVIADFIVANPNFYVIDLSGIEHGEEFDLFCTTFARRLYYLKDKDRSPLHIFADEADMFAPQQLERKGQKALLASFEAIVRRGGIRGLGMTMISQRSAVLNNNLLMQCEVMIALQTTGPADIDAIDKWIRKNASDDEREEFLASVAKLKTGEAYVWSPAWLEIFKRVTIRERRTFNSSATPKVGDLKREPTKLANVDLEKLTTAMSATIEKVKAEDPEFLKREISELKKQLNAKSVPVAALPAAAPVEPKIKEIPVLKDSQILRIEQVIKSIETLQEKAREKDQAHIEAVAKYLDDYKANSAERSQHLQQQATEIVEAMNRVSAAKNMPIPTDKPNFLKPPASRPQEPEFKRPVPQQYAENMTKGDGLKLSAKQQKMLDTLLTFESLGRNNIDRSIVATFSGISSKSSGFRNYLSELKTAGLITYEAGACLALTTNGRSLARSTVVITSVKDLHKAWKDQIKASKQIGMIELVIAEHPHPVTRNALAEHTDQSITSSGFRNYLSTLRSLGIIDYTSVPRNDGTGESDPGVKATDLLFPDGLN